LLLVGERAAQLEDAALRLGLSPMVFEDPLSALEALTQMHPGDVAVVVCDLHLENVETRDFLRRAQSLAPAPGYLLLADPAESGLIASNMIHGADGYIPIPVDLTHLESTLRRHVAAARGRWMEPGAKDRLFQEIETLQAALRVAERERDALANKNAELSVSIEQLLDEVRDMIAARKGARGFAGVRVRQGPLGVEESDEGTTTIPISSREGRPRPQSAPTAPDRPRKAEVAPAPPFASDWAESPTRAERLPQSATELDSDELTGEDEHKTPPPMVVRQHPRPTNRDISDDGASAATALIPEIGTLSLVREELSALFESEGESSGRVGMFESPSEAALFEFGDGDPISRPPRSPTKTKPRGGS